MSFTFPHVESCNKNLQQNISLLYDSSLSFAAIKHDFRIHGCGHCVSDPVFPLWYTLLPVHDKAEMSQMRSYQVENILAKWTNVQVKCEICYKAITVIIKGENDKSRISYLCAILDQVLF